MEILLDNLPEQSVASGDMASIAYIKPLSTDGNAGYGVYTAGGEQLGIFQSYESAFFTARQCNFAPVSVH